MAVKFQVECSGFWQGVEKTTLNYPENLISNLSIASSIHTPYSEDLVFRTVKRPDLRETCEHFSEKGVREVTKV
jgi:hypothetical protein